MGEQEIQVAVVDLDELREYARTGRRLYIEHTRATSSGTVRHSTVGYLAQVTATLLTLESAGRSSNIPVARIVRLEPVSKGGA